MLGLSPNGWPQSYPTKPIRLISPLAPGGGTDILARGIAVAKVLRADELKSRARAEGLDPAGGSPEEFGKVIRRDIEKMARVIRDARIQREG